jgi:hypothetical protein
VQQLRGVESQLETLKVAQAVRECKTFAQSLSVGRARNVGRDIFLEPSPHDLCCCRARVQQVEKPYGVVVLLGQNVLFLVKIFPSDGQLPNAPKQGWCPWHTGSFEVETGAGNAVSLFPSHEVQGREYADMQVEKLPNRTVTLHSISLETL